MYGEFLVANHLGLHAHPRAMHFQFACAVQERAPTCAYRLIAGQHDGMNRLGEHVLDMVQDAAAGEHAGGRHNDGRLLRIVEFLRLFLVSHLNEIQVAQLQASHFIIEFAARTGSLVKTKRGERHGGVHVDWHRGDLAGSDHVG